eukprot:4906082-Pyramimonas_sp.AAC.1
MASGGVTKSLKRRKPQMLQHILSGPREGPFRVRVGSLPLAVTRGEQHMTVDAFLPSRGGIDPSRGGIDLSRGGIDPSRGGIDPTRGGIDPTRGGIDPSRGGIDPSRGGID